MYILPSNVDKNAIVSVMMRAFGAFFSPERAGIYLKNELTTCAVYLYNIAWGIECFDCPELPFLTAEVRKACDDWKKYIYYAGPDFFKSNFMQANVGLLKNMDSMNMFTAWLDAEYSKSLEYERSSSGNESNRLSFVCVYDPNCLPKKILLNGKYVPYVNPLQFKRRLYISLREVRNLQNWYDGRYVQDWEDFPEVLYRKPINLCLTSWQFLWVFFIKNLFQFKPL